MVTNINAVLDLVAVHKVGNATTADTLVLSEQPLVIEDEMLQQVLVQYFTTSFTKTSEVYHLQHSSGNLQLNEIFHYASELFDDAGAFHEHSKNIARHLLQSSTHPNIKTGELYVVLFRNLQVEGEELDALGIFKSEQKETYLKVYPKKDGFNIAYEDQAINIKKLDKGALIFNAQKDAGYKVLITDGNNRQPESVFWMDDFLQVTPRNDPFNKTANTLNMYKDFVTKQMDEEFGISKPEKIDLLNRSLRYFKEKEVFDVEDFAAEVIGNPEGISSFRNYKKNYEEEFETELGDSFSINTMAVKKQSRFMKSVLKLDKNFHIYIHGSNDLIEKGFDPTVNKQFYKLYFTEES